ncbi:hypothetical protein JMUB7512_27790 [Staphylococcus aureus]
MQRSLVGSEMCIRDSSKELSKSDKDKVLGLFADKNMPLAIDASKDEPSLADMQQSALSKLSLIHISEPTRLRCISYAVFCLKKS